MAKKKKAEAPADKKPPVLFKKDKPVIYVDCIVDTVTGEEHSPEEYANVLGDMLNSAPNERLKKKRGDAQHVVHTPMGYDVYFHLITHDGRDYEEMMKSRK